VGCVDFLFFSIQKQQHASQREKERERERTDPKRLHHHTNNCLILRIEAPDFFSVHMYNIPTIYSHRFQRGGSDGYGRSQAPHLLQYPGVI